MTKKISKRERKETPAVENIQVAEESAPILNKLLSQDKNDIAWAAAAISNLVQQPDPFKLLVANNVVGHLSSSITSHSAEVQVELVGALRNIALYGGVELCKEMHRKSVVSGIQEMVVVIKEMVDAVVDNTVQPDQHDKLNALSDLAEQAFHLLALLSEAHLPAFKDIERIPSLIEILVNALTHADKFPLSLINAVGQLTLVLSESSKPMLLFFRANKQVVNTLMSIANGSTFPALRSWTDKSINVPIMCAGIIYNIKTVYASKNTRIELKGLLDAVQMIAIECCNLDLEAVITSGFASTMNRNGESDLSSSNKTEECENVLETLLVAVELLTNVFCDDSRVNERKPFRPTETTNATNEEENDDIIYGSEDEEAMDHDETTPTQEAVSIEVESDEFSDNESADEDDAYDIMQDDVMFENESAMEVESSTHTIDALLMNLVNFAEFKVPSILSISTKNIVSLLYSIKAGSFGAIGNLIDKCASAWVKQHCAKLWQWSFNEAMQVSQHSVSFDNDKTLDNAYILDLSENIVTVLWALIRRISHIDPTIIMSTTQSISAFIETSKNKSASENIRAKSICILSHLGKHQNQIPSNKLIGETLIEILMDPTTSVLLLSETLNALFDIYCDENFDYDCVFREGGYVAKIKQVSNAIKIKVKNLDKRKYRDVRDQADEAVTNMKAFILYKEGEYLKMGL